MKITKLFIAMLAVAAIACEPADNNDPLPPQNNTEEPTEDEENKEDENKDDENKGDEELGEMKEVPESTYMLSENLDARVHPLQTNGLRNDYASFFDVYRDITLFIDFYAPLECEYLPSGYYPLGDGSAMTSAQEYTYVTLETGADFIPCIDGWAVVTAKHNDETGDTTHKVTAYYTMENGETISVEYEGVFTIKQGV